MEAMFCSEERYSSLTIYFQSKEEKRSVCDLMDDLIPQYDIKPNIIIKPLTKDTKGEIAIEFHDDYNQEAHPIIEKLSKALQLEFLPCTI
jgi:hypothetical protein